jgi:hypothetical protein
MKNSKATLAVVASNGVLRPAAVEPKPKKALSAEEEALERIRLLLGADAGGLTLEESGGADPYNNNRGRPGGFPGRNGRRR